jgi:hypothetical protein
VAQRPVFYVLEEACTCVLANATKIVQVPSRKTDVNDAIWIVQLLEHATDPRSIVCCVKGCVDFDDPVARQAYIAVRRHPDLRSVAPHLRAHCGRFWSK